MYRGFPPWHLDRQWMSSVPFWPGACHLLLHEDFLSYETKFADFLDFINTLGTIILSQTILPLVLLLSGCVICWVLSLVANPFKVVGGMNICNRVKTSRNIAQPKAYKSQVFQITWSEQKSEIFDTRLYNGHL